MKSRSAPAVPRPPTLLGAALLAVLLAPALAGCAHDVSGYPSLAPRKIESEARPAPANPAGPAPAPTIVAPAGMPPALARIVDDAGKADGAFQAALAKSRGTIEKGIKSPVGSEAWIVAQQAYSALDATRAPIAAALADLDKLRQQAMEKGEDGGAIAAAAQQVQATDEAERAILAQINPPG